jgi:beta-lactam-binding protein with PASTA domain
MAKAQAVSLIQAVGLKASITLTKTCDNPGKVLSQTPNGDSVAPPGGTVRITVDSGTSRTCT